jgi:hypothetical protein
MVQISFAGELAKDMPRVRSAEFLDLSGYFERKRIGSVCGELVRENVTYT